MQARQNPRGRILVGFAGWSYPDWKGLVYPRETQFDKLQYLAKFFNTIEINNSFYAIPARQLVEGWMRSVTANPEFLFTVKLYKQFTHGDKIQEGKPKIVKESLTAFKTALQPMLEMQKLGALLLQFPYRFHYKPKNLEYLLTLLEALEDYPLVVEVRHKSFDHPAFYELLEERQVAFANIDQPAVSDSLPPTRVFTSSRLAYLRFHGRNAETWFAAEAGRDARYDYDYSVEELEPYLGMIREFRERQGTLYVIFNNHYRAAEVKNALEFIHQITGQPVKIMPHLLRAYPDLARIALSPEPEKKEVLPGETYSLFGEE